MGSNQTTVAYTGLAGALATVAVFVATQLGVDMTAEVGAAVATIAVGVVGYFTKPKPAA